MSYDYYDRLPDIAKVRYNCKLEAIGLIECPYRLPAGSWINDPTQWPEVEWGDLYSYLIESPGVFTRESMKNYKSLDAHIFFKSGWVHTIYSYKPNTSTVTVLKANVVPSWRVNDEPHHPWVAVTKDGTISSAHCDCKAGLGESCSHVAAILFKIEAAVRLGYTTRTCTDEPCKWNMDFVKKVNPAPISNIQFFKDAGIERTRKRKRDDTKTFPKATESEKHSFLGAISKCKTKPIVLSTFYGYSESFHWKKNPVKSPQLPLSLRTLYQETGKDVTDISEEIMDKAMKKIAISKEQSQFICETTKAQSDSLVWREQRIGRITSSNVHRVLHTDQDNPSQSLVLSICTQSRDFKTEATKWGKDHEAVALKEYEKLMKTSHTDFDINPTGLLISPDYAFVGASADSVSSCSCHGKRVVEVKCPFTHRESTLQEYLVHKSSCLGTSPHIHIKETHSYFSQVQLQMMVHDVSLADFVIWTPKFTILVHVPRNIEFIEKMKTIIVPFYRRHILPELLTRKLESSKSAPLKENTPPKLYCFCQKPESGDMIGCDEPKCSYQWFHMSCVKLKKGPKHSWYCKDCRKDRQTKK